MSFFPGAGRAELPAKSSGHGNLVEWLVTVSIKSAGQPRMALTRQFSDVGQQADPRHSRKQDDC